jgi:hypothetical protein
VRQPRLSSPPAAAAARPTAPARSATRRWEQRPPR